MIKKDKEWIDNIASIKKWAEFYCPQDYFIKLLDKANDVYLQDFSYLLQQQSQMKNQDELLKYYN